MEALRTINLEDGGGALQPAYPRTARAYCDRIVGMSGQVVFDGSRQRSPLTCLDRRGRLDTVPDTAITAASMSVPGQQSIELLPATS